MPFTFIRDMKKKKDKEFFCATPKREYPNVILAHGGGGKLTQDLIKEVFLPNFQNKILSPLTDSAILDFKGLKLAFTTDGYVVKPIFFPGGDIGKLSIFGTLNDLSVMGAKPLYISASFIIEEGFSLEDLKKITKSMKDAVSSSGVFLVTGDTKVVEKGKGDGLFISTSGIGVVIKDPPPSPERIKEGDYIIINGDVGRHGMAILAKREGFQVQGNLESDCANLSPIILKLIEEGIEINAMRDLTRGGLATCLIEMAKSCSLNFIIEEKKIPVKEEVLGFCELLGFDPLYVANEGKFVSFVSRRDCDKAIEIMKSFEEGKDATCIGYVEGKGGNVILEPYKGARRFLSLLSGEQLPRIC